MEMFCFQCQETCRNTGCDKQGACGKTAQTAAIQDKLIQVVKAISVKRQLVDKDVISDDELGLFVVQSLFMTITNANFDEERLNAQIARGLQILQTLGGSIAELSNIPLGVMSCENEDVRSLRELITYGLPPTLITPPCWARRTKRFISLLSELWLIFRASERLTN